MTRAYEISPPQNTPPEERTKPRDQREVEGDVNGCRLEKTTGVILIRGQQAVGFFPTVATGIGWDSTIPEDSADSLVESCFKYSSPLLIMLSKVIDNFPSAM